MAMPLRLAPEDEQALTLLAEAEGVSKQEATARAIHEAASRGCGAGSSRRSARLG
jgi:hypothetical protein